MSFDKVVVGVAKCPNTKKLYGVRIEINRNKWTATWAFPIKERVAKREGYTENQFPPDLIYSEEFPGCPYCKKHEDLAKTSVKSRQAYKFPRILVSSKCFDDVGSILSSMRIGYGNYNGGDWKCDILFVNCGTADQFDSMRVRSFVERGGCVYASDWADNILKVAFPGVFDTSRTGSVQSVVATVEDLELKSVIGKEISVYFDLGGWAVLKSAKNSKCILRSKETQLPIMVSVKYGKGTIFYTCFHNHAQASEKEKALLQLLVLKQIGTNENLTIDEAGAALGIDIDAIKAKFRTNF